MDGGRPESVCAETMIELGRARRRADAETISAPVANALSALDVPIALTNPLDHGAFAGKPAPAPRRRRRGSHGGPDRSGTSRWRRSEGTVNTTSRVNEFRAPMHVADPPRCDEVHDARMTAGTSPPIADGTVSNLARSDGGVCRAWLRGFRH